MTIKDIRMPPEPLTPTSPTPAKDMASNRKSRRSTARCFARTLLATVAVAVASLGVLTTPASAQLNHPYDGTDPAATGCANTARQVAAVPVAGGTLQLMWSNACHTNWARFTGGNAGYVAVWVYRQADNQWCGDQSGNGCGGQWWINGAYSNQLYGCNYPEMAQVEIWNNGSPYWRSTPFIGGC